MPIQILQKAVEELNNKKPRLEYLRGLLETLLEMQPKPIVFTQPKVTPEQPFVPPPPPINPKAITIGKIPPEN